MPYRPGIISQSEDFVGELGALSEKLLRTKGARFPVEYKFDSEDELIAAADKMELDDRNDRSLIEARKLYSMYWGLVKYQEGLRHRDHPSHCEPTSRRPWSCGLCLCGKGMSMRCRCDEGKKMLSPNRIVFVNSAVAWETRNLIYSIGEGYVPKKNPEQAPDWRSFDWGI